MSWRSIQLKYAGKCVVCEKPVPVGSQVMWLKGTGIKHPECASAPSIKCIVCGKPAGCASCEFFEDCDLENISQACMCASCAAEPGAFDKYRAAAGRRPGQTSLI